MDSILKRRDSVGFGFMCTPAHGRYRDSSFIHNLSEIYPLKECCRTHSIIRTLKGRKEIGIEFEERDCLECPKLFSIYFRTSTTFNPNFDNIRTFRGMVY